MGQLSTRAALGTRPCTGERTLRLVGWSEQNLTVAHRRRNPAFQSQPWRVWGHQAASQTLPRKQLRKSGALLP